MQISELENAAPSGTAEVAAPGKGGKEAGGSEPALTGAAKMKADKQIKDLERKLGLYQKQDTAQKQEARRLASLRGAHAGMQLAKLKEQQAELEKTSNKTQVDLKVLQAEFARVRTLCYVRVTTHA